MEPYLDELCAVLGLQAVVEAVVAVSVHQLKALGAGQLRRLASQLHRPLGQFGQHLKNNREN